MTHLLAVATLSGMCGTEDDAAELSCWQVNQGIHQLGELFRFLYRRRNGRQNGHAVTTGAFREIVSTESESGLIADSAWSEWNFEIDWVRSCRQSYDPVRRQERMQTLRISMGAMIDAAEMVERDLRSSPDPRAIAVRSMLQGLEGRADFVQDARSIWREIGTACNRPRDRRAGQDAALMRRIYTLQRGLIDSRDRLQRLAEQGGGFIQLPTCSATTPSDPEAFRERVRLIAADIAANPDQDELELPAGRAGDAPTGTTPRLRQVVPQFR